MHSCCVVPCRFYQRQNEWNNFIIVIEIYINMPYCRHFIYIDIYVYISFMKQQRALALLFSIDINYYIIIIIIDNAYYDVHIWEIFIYSIYIVTVLLLNSFYITIYLSYIFNTFRIDGYCCRALAMDWCSSIEIHLGWLYPLHAQYPNQQTYANFCDSFLFSSFAQGLSSLFGLCVLCCCYWYWYYYCCCCAISVLLQEKIGSRECISGYVHVYIHMKWTLRARCGRLEYIAILFEQHGYANRQHLLI